jgi:hypothetical protein
MGWTNSVPIFHDNVTFILWAGIPHIMIPYIDDVPVKGPKSTYLKIDRTFNTISGNPSDNPNTTQTLEYTKDMYNTKIIK